MTVERLQKVIATRGLASRRQAEVMIVQGRVRVNGVLVTELGTKVDHSTAEIQVDGKVLAVGQELLYLLVHKPIGYVTTMDDPQHRPIVSDLLAGIDVRVYPVGRLDINSSGLLFCTNDGELAHRMMHPRYKIYIVPRGNGCEGIDLEYCKECKLSQTTGYKRYIVGATEIESEDDSPISVRSNMELLSALYTVHPSFGEARVVNSETNCRPAFKDNLPRIENETGLTRINGLYRHGYLLAPAIVEKALAEGMRN